MALTSPFVRWRYATQDSTPSDADWQFGLRMLTIQLQDALLWDAIRQADIERELRQEFTLTDPLWYGLWMNSPLTPTQCGLLHRLLSEIEIRTDDRKTFANFLKALQTARNEGRSIEVEFIPLGETDFGWYTIFPHCPRCHASTRMVNAAYAQACFEALADGSDLTCPICGTVYDPHETGSMAEMPEMEPRTFLDSLRIHWASFWGLLLAPYFLFGNLRFLPPEEEFRRDYRLRKPSKRR